MALIFLFPWKTHWESMPNGMGAGSFSEDGHLDDCLVSTKAAHALQERWFWDSNGNFLPKAASPTLHAKHLQGK